MQMVTKLSRTVLTGLALLLFAGTLQGQTASQFSVQPAPIVRVFPSAESLATGYGGEFQFRYTPGQFSIGIGAEMTRHGFEGFHETVWLAGVFVEPRVTMDVGSNAAAPYISARVGSAELDGDAPDFAIFGIDQVTLNGGGGLLVRLGSRVNMDLGATAGVFGTHEFNVVARVGAAIGL